MKPFTEHDHKKMAKASERLKRAEALLNKLTSDTYPDLIESLVDNCESNMDHILAHQLRTATKQIEGALRTIEGAHSMLSVVQCEALAASGEDVPIIAATDR